MHLGSRHGLRAIFEARSPSGRPITHKLPRGFVPSVRGTFLAALPGTPAGSENSLGRRLTRHGVLRGTADGIDPLVLCSLFLIIGGDFEVSERVFDSELSENYA